ncbi:hypothetical protein, partial [Burkholderia sola]|uniref:hypothetical protein n=1 Tax=Burkholderia sola TaxID=2843302 RepID=UPI00338F08A8
NTDGENSSNLSLAESDDLGLLHFHSLEFTEVAMLLEDEIGHELHFDARPMREVNTVGELIDFLLLLSTRNEHHGTSGSQQ